MFYIVKYYLLVIQIWIIFYSLLFYSFEKNNEKLFVPTNCQINETLIKQIPCWKSNQTLCRINSYGINTGKNGYGYYNTLPSWFSPKDKEDLHQNPMIYLGKSLFKPLNLSCYYDRLNVRIRWSRTDPEGFIYLIGISSIVICLTIIDCSFGEYYSRRS